MKDNESVAQVRSQVIESLTECIKSLDSVGDKVAAIFIQNAVDDLRERLDTHQNGPNISQL